jgi:dinuclear metal center YbgI/SA1388 family protein
MLHLHELCLFLDNELQPHKFKDFAPNGLQVEGSSEISKIATAVSSGLDTIEKAAEAQVQALIVHHGLFWKNQCYLPKNVLRKKLELLFRSNMSLIAYHLPLDANEDVGNNWEAARQLGWSQLKAFPEHENHALGVKGTIDPIFPEEFQKELETFYNQKAHVAPGNKTKIERVALISGGAHWQLQEAIDEGLDAFVTGSFDEPIWNLARESGVYFYALGHHATERIGVQTLGTSIKNHFSNVEVEFIDSDNPF